MSDCGTEQCKSRQTRRAVPFFMWGLVRISIMVPDDVTSLR